MVKSIKCCTQVKECKDWELFIVSVGSEVINYFDKGSFGTVMGAETRLEDVETVISS